MSGLDSYGVYGLHPVEDLIPELDRDTALHLIRRIETARPIAERHHHPDLPVHAAAPVE
jgi:hypothetical protein